MQIDGRDKHIVGYCIVFNSLRPTVMDVSLEQPPKMNQLDVEEGDVVEKSLVYSFHTNDQEKMLK